VTRSNGIRTIWSIKIGSEPVSKVFVWGEVDYDIREPNILSVSDIRYTSYTIDTATKGKGKGKDKESNWRMSPFKPHPYTASYYNVVSPTFIIQKNLGKESPRGLLITAYGAYGYPTKIGRLVERWRPLLNRGWAIASVTVPGSGDDDLTWRFAAQGPKRKLAVDTLCATIKDIQEELEAPPAATALYGRSAGGLLVSAVLTESPGLIGALYMESPYVDTLRTLTNPDLPLSILETKEFGDPRGFTDVVALGSWSPMEGIPEKGFPDIFVVARSDLADLEVLPYEPMKFIRRVRGRNEANHKAKLLYISESKGHFTTDRQSRAEDLALLENWLIKNMGFKYMMANVQLKNKNKSRKNKDRKDAKGGARKATRKDRKGGARKASRKDRKNKTRKH